MPEALPGETYRYPAEIEDHTALPTTLSTALATAVPTTTPAVPAPAPAPAPATTPPPPSAGALSPSAIAGLCIGLGLAAVLLAYALFDFLVLRGRRRERALRRAVAVVQASSGASSVGSLEQGGGVGGDKEVGEMGGVGKEGEGCAWGRKALSLPRRV